MMVPERFSGLPEYAFPRLRRLLDGLSPGGPVVDMTIGEPRHPMPSFLMQVLAEHQAGFAKYPPNEGAPILREAIADWLDRRYAAPTDPDTEILALNGTREGLFNAGLALCPEKKNGRRPAVLVPNPFYQVYAVAAAAAGAEAVFLNATVETGFLPDYAGLDGDLLDRTAIAYICSPSNPQGAVASRDYWVSLLTLAEKHDFLVFADECYSEIWRSAPPVGAWQVAQEMGLSRERLLIFHSLSKRSNLPGLRAGFCATGPNNMVQLKRLRSYAGAPLPLPIQHAAAACWRDEAHVEHSRKLYQEKYRIADGVMSGLPGYVPPEGGFFLWLPVPPALGNGEDAVRTIFARTGVKLLPGAYLSRDTDEGNPGDQYIRVAMVAEAGEMARGLGAVRALLDGSA